MSIVCNGVSCTINGAFVPSGSSGVLCQFNQCSVNGVVYPNINNNTNNNNINNNNNGQVSCGTDSCIINGQRIWNGQAGVSCVNQQCSYNGQLYPNTLGSSASNGINTVGGVSCNGFSCFINGITVASGTGGVLCANNQCTYNGVLVPTNNNNGFNSNNNNNGLFNSNGAVCNGINQCNINGQIVTQGVQCSSNGQCTVNGMSYPNCQTLGQGACAQYRLSGAFTRIQSRPIAYSHNPPPAVKYQCVCVCFEMEAQQFPSSRAD
ncbi:hypothetical protein HDU80_008296 [Chytriomyces hyalinus]|nr:hypothetical protein HDU80_008296 [Chytriomyces hyalinus]